MVLFQALVLAFFFGVTAFLPVAPEAHPLLLAHATGWGEPSPEILASLALGAFLALLFSFRHDWASIVSSCLRMLFFRKRPRTLDEYMPLFLIVSSVPYAMARVYLTPELMGPWVSDIRWVLLLFVTSYVLVWFGNGWGKRVKGMFDWNGWDAFLVGLGQVLAFVPGVGRMTGAISVGFLRGYHREVAVRFALFASAPVLLIDVIWGFRREPQGGMNPTYTGLIILLAFLLSLLAISAIQKAAQRLQFRGYLVYRIIAAAAVPFLAWLRIRLGWGG